MNGLFFFSLLLGGSCSVGGAAVSPSEVKTAPTSEKISCNIVIEERDGCTQKVLIGRPVLEQNITDICEQLTPWMISRVAGDGSLSGSGYGCTIIEVDERGLGHSICTDSLQTSGDVAQGLAVCPLGTAIASPQEVSRNKENFCRSLGEWEIVRLANGASLSGLGYSCHLIEQDERSLGSTLCH